MYSVLAIIVNILAMKFDDVQTKIIFEIDFK